MCSGDQSATANECALTILLTTSTQHRPQSNKRPMRAVWTGDNGGLLPFCRGKTRGSRIAHAGKSRGLRVAIVTLASLSHLMDRQVVGSPTVSEQPSDAAQDPISLKPVDAGRDEGYFRGYGRRHIPLRLTPLSLLFLEEIHVPTVV